MPANRLMSGMHKVISHDLPNQLVAIQGLLQLLSLEETDRLSASGCEYVRRLQNATRRAADIGRFLKEMEKLRTWRPNVDIFALSALAGELRSDLLACYPDRHFEFAWQWAVPKLKGDPRLLVQAVRELFAALSPPNVSGFRVSGISRKCGNAVELAFDIESLAESAGASRCGDPLPPLDQRMEIILACECLALVDGKVEIHGDLDGHAKFSLIIPDR